MMDHVYPRKALCRKLPENCRAIWSLRTIVKWHGNVTIDFRQSIIARSFSYDRLRIYVCDYYYYWYYCETIIAREALSKWQIFRDLFIILIKHLLVLMLPNSEFRGSPIHGISPTSRSYNRFYGNRLFPVAILPLVQCFNQSCLLTWFPAGRDKKLIRAYHSVFKITWIVDFWRCYEESFNHVIDIMEIFSSCFLCWMASERVDCETVNRKVEYCRITEYV